MPSEESPLTDNVQPTPEGPEEEKEKQATKMSQQGDGGGRGGGRQQRETLPTCDQPVEDTQTSHQQNDTAYQNPQQQDAPLADSDAKFHVAKELLEDTEGVST